MATATGARSSGPPRTDKQFSLADVTSKGSGLPNRWIFHGTEGSGKTSLAARFPAPIFIQSKGETGLDSLIDSGQLAETPHFPECQSWNELFNQISILSSGKDHGYKTLVIDTLNGCEKLCHEHVVAEHYAGKAGKDGFLSYAQGYEVSLGEWRNLLNLLDEVRKHRKMTIVCPCHTRVAPFRNPEGTDYDRYQPALHAKTWELTARWADAVVFLNFETFVSEKSGRAKGTGGSSRVLYTERHAAYDAKNRMGLALEIPLGDSADSAWKAFAAAVAAARKPAAPNDMKGE